MTSYAEKQLFKTRFWKHVWDLDPESLRDLLEQGNPVGNLDFKFRVVTGHGYTFHTAYNGEYVEVNTAIGNYLASNAKTAVDILWEIMYECKNEPFLALPCGSTTVNCDAFETCVEVAMILWAYGGLDEDKINSLFKWCEHHTTHNLSIGKKLWKLRLVTLDPVKWPTTNAFDDVSTEELQAMYEGHPKNVNLHEVEIAVSDRPTKKAKSSSK